MNPETTLEQYAYSQLAPHLGHGETILEYGTVVQVGRRKRKRHAGKLYIAGITPYRIMLIETRARLLAGYRAAPKLENRGLVIHPLNEIKAAEYAGVRRFGPWGWQPMKLWFHGGGTVEYHIPINTKICASQVSLSTYPARLQHILTTPPPWPSGRLPAVPAQVIQQWDERFAEAYGAKRTSATLWGVGGVVATVLGIGTGFGMLALFGIPACVAGGSIALRNVVDKRNRDKGPLPRCGWAADALPLDQPQPLAGGVNTA